MAQKAFVEGERTTGFHTRARSHARTRSNARPRPRCASGRVGEEGREEGRKGVCRGGGDGCRACAGTRQGKARGSPESGAGAGSFDDELDLDEALAEGIAKKKTMSDRIKERAAATKASLTKAVKK